MSVKAFSTTATSKYHLTSYNCNRQLVIWLLNCSALLGIFLTPNYLTSSTVNTNNRSGLCHYVFDSLATYDTAWDFISRTPLCITDLWSNYIFLPQQCRHLGTHHVCLVVYLHHVKAVLWSKPHSAAFHITKCTNHLLNITQLYVRICWIYFTQFRQISNGWSFPIKTFSMTIHHITHSSSNKSCLLQI